MPRVLISVLISLVPLTTLREVTFRAIPASQSGITWVHVNGRSDKRYLPETFGPGVAIFDYNNDGWMDIFVVNSGDSVFFHPPTRFAMRSTETKATKLLRMLQKRLVLLLISSAWGLP